MVLYIPGNQDPNGLTRLGEYLGAVAKQYGEAQRYRQDSSVLMNALKESRDDAGNFDPIKFYEGTYGKVNPQSLADFSAPLAMAYNASKDRNAQQAALLKAASKQTGTSTLSPSEKLNKELGFKQTDLQHLSNRGRKIYNHYQSVKSRNPNYNAPQELWNELEQATQRGQSESKRTQTEAMLEKTDMEQQMKTARVFTEGIEQDAFAKTSLVGELDDASNIVANELDLGDDWLNSANTTLQNLLAQNPILKPLSSKARAALETKSIQIVDQLKSKFGRVLQAEFDKYPELYPNAKDTPAQYAAKLRVYKKMAQKANGLADYVQEQKQLNNGRPPLEIVSMSRKWLQNTGLEKDYAPELKIIRGQKADPEQMQSPTRQANLNNSDMSALDKVRQKWAGRG